MTLKWNYTLTGAPCNRDAKLTRDIQGRHSKIKTQNSRLVSCLKLHSERGFQDTWRLRKRDTNGNLQ